MVKSNLFNAPQIKKTTNVGLSLKTYPYLIMIFSVKMICREFTYFKKTIFFDAVNPPYFITTK